MTSSVLEAGDGPQSFFKHHRDKFHGPVKMTNDE